MLPPDALVFLAEAGLPFNCAPYLSFGPFVGGLKSVDQIYDTGQQHFTALEKDRLSSYLVIGGDGEGSPVCIDISHSGQIVVLDHDLDFQSVLFVNSSVPQLVECLLAYRTLVEMSLAENGEDALMDGNIPEHAKQEAVSQMILTDPDAMNLDCFWIYEIDDLGSA